jgi:hypothetical protein
MCLVCFVSNVCCSSSSSSTVCFVSMYVVLVRRNRMCCSLLTTADGSGSTDRFETACFSRLLPSLSFLRSLSFVPSFLLGREKEMDLCVRLRSIPFRHSSPYWVACVRSTFVTDRCRIYIYTWYIYIRDGGIRDSSLSIRTY